jgi:tRNA (guanine37-N1)-methyltransferase
MKFHIVSLFPELIQAYCSTSIIGRGAKAGKLTVLTYNPRDFCLDKYRKVDDTPYGGGAGMVLKPEPIFAAVESIDRPSGGPVLLMTPQGSPFKQSDAEQLANTTDIVIICGHYEGFDERIRTLATQEISIGDFVITGGELAALTVIDAVGRLIPGVLGKQCSLAEESFNGGLLEGPQYTKPPEFRGMIVPEILRSGDHKAIAAWRRNESIKRTVQRRPDLLPKADMTQPERRIVEKLHENLPPSEL